MDSYIFYPLEYGMGAAALMCFAVSAIVYLTKRYRHE